MNKIVLFLFLILTGCKTAEKDCIELSRINKEAICTMQYDPVCGCDLKTYGNPCAAENAGVVRYTKGECQPKN